MPYKTPAARLAAGKRYRDSHKESERARRQRYNAQNPAKVLLKSAREAAAKYGWVPPRITEEELSRLLASRGELCPICRLNSAGHLDHDHVTGVVRGWLCNNCNLLLGHAGDDPAILLRAKEYLNAKH